MITLIVVATLVAGAATSFFAADAGRDTLTVLTGDLLVVSMAIFLAAVAAAVYAKAAYDAGRALEHPPKLELVGIQVRDGDADCPCQHVDGVRSYSMKHPRPGSVKVVVRLRLKPKEQPREIYTILMVGEPAKLAPASERSELQPIDIKSKYSIHDKEVDVSGMNGQETIMTSVECFYQAQLDLPSGPSPWPEGWPMRFTVCGTNQEVRSLDESWWVVEDAGAPSPGTLARGISAL